MDKLDSPRSIIKVLRSGRTTVSISRQLRGGKKTPYYGVSLSKFYFVDENIKNTNWLNADEVPMAVELMKQADEIIKKDIIQKIA